jgi:ABC-2 type transport system ATP-binding protein
MSNVVIKIENLSKKYGNLIALNNLNLEVNKGEIIGLIGPNGAGKTTTLKLIARLIRPHNGKILIKNKQGELQNIFENSKNLIEMGFLLDIPQFLNTTPYRLLKYISNIRNYPKDKIKERINYFLKYFDLIDWKYKKIRIFSKGMMQKLGFIAAIIHDPEIIILDEPQTGMDPNARVKVRGFIKSLQKEGKTIFLSSHLLYEIGEICDKIALIDSGLIVAFDSIENLSQLLNTKELICKIANPISPENVGQLIKKMNLKLEPYLETDTDNISSNEKIMYDPQKKQFRINYNGELIESKGEILNILVNEFKSDFTIDSYSELRTNQLEHLYFQMIGENEIPAKTKFKRGYKRWKN